MKYFRQWTSTIVVSVASLVLLSCAEGSSPVATNARSNLDLGGVTQTFSGTSLLACTPMTADSVTQSVGVLGGTIYVGPHRLEIPALALDSTVAITAVAPSDSVNRIHFEPEGLTFNKKASLYMSYANCDPITDLIPKRVAFVSADLSTILDLLSSLDLYWNDEVRGKLDHFSDYIVAW